MFRNSILLLTILVATVTFAQQKPPAHAARPASKPAATSDATALPTEETVYAFLHQMFGFDPSLTFKVQDIRPAKAEGLAEVTVVASNAQGQQQSNKFFVTSDGRHAIFGDIMPFGTDPF